MSVSGVVVEDVEAVREHLAAIRDVVEDIEPQSQRDQLAALAMNGLLAGGQYVTGNERLIAERSYKLADAMLRERAMRDVKGAA